LTIRAALPSGLPVDPPTGERAGTGAARSVRGLPRALLLNDRLADKALDARDVLQANRLIVGDMLAEPAAQDHHQACLALVVADADGTPALHHARQRLDQLLAPGRTQPDIVTMSAESHDAAILVRLLSRSCRLGSRAP
jgi:hypothetical protein